MTKKAQMVEQLEKQNMLITRLKVQIEDLETEVHELRQKIEDFSNTEFEATAVLEPCRGRRWRGCYSPIRRRSICIPDCNR